MKSRVRAHSRVLSLSRRNRALHIVARNFPIPFSLSFRFFPPAQCASARQLALTRPREENSERVLLLKKTIRDFLGNDEDFHCAAILTVYRTTVRARELPQNTRVHRIHAGCERLLASSCAALRAIRATQLKKLNRHTHIHIHTPAPVMSERDGKRGW